MHQLLAIYQGVHISYFNQTIQRGTYSRHTAAEDTDI